MNNISQQRQTKVMISNLPNTTPREHILEYLQTAGPIKECNFDESGQRLSATVVYFDYESAQTAKKFLDQRQLNTRKIKISLDQSKDYKTDPNFNLKSKLSILKKDDKRQDKTNLLRYLKALRDQEGNIFVQFLEANPWLVQELLKLQYD